MGRDLKTSIERAFLKKLAQEGEAHQRDGSWFVKVAREDAGPGATYNRTFEVKLDDEGFVFEEV